jgi:hypothetical protein
MLKYENNSTAPVTSLLLTSEIKYKFASQITIFALSCTLHTHWNIGLLDNRPLNE